MPDYPVKNAAGTVIVAAANTSGYGSTGKDYSANKPALMANILATIPANGSRTFAEVMNQDASDIQVVLYDVDGGAGYGVLTIAGGSADNKEGADWTSTNFKGKVEVRGAAGTEQVYVHEE